MMKYFFCCLILFSQVRLSFSQSRQDTVLVVPAAKGMYFYHIANQGETLYSLSRKFQVDVKKLASFNKLTLHTPLKIYQLVKIPLNDKNLKQSAGVSAASGLEPLYHRVTKGETLYHISQLHDKVSTAALKKWNHLQGNAVKTGQYLIVGWLSKQGEGNVASNATQINDSTSPAADVQKKTINKERPASPDEAKAGAPAPPEKKTTTPPRQSAASSGGNNFLNEVIASEDERRRKGSAGNNIARKPAHQGKKKVAEPLKIKTKPPVTSAEEDAFTVQANPAARQPVKEEEKKPAPAVVKKEAPKKPDSFALMLDRVTSGPQKKVYNSGDPQIYARLKTAKPAAYGATAEKTTGESDQLPSAPVHNGTDSSQLALTAKSKFQALYDQQTQNNTEITVKKGAAGWFRSNVKPGSGSYYALCNNLPRGTIVKVTNPINQKSVLVKILDVIPKQKENYNLIIKLSDAAMGDLGISQSRFWCQITYANQKSPDN